MAHVRSLFFEGPLADVENKAITAYKLGRPSEIIWNITNRCNLLCDHCYMAADAQEKPEQLSDEEALGLVDQMAEAGVPLLFMSGGEPMVRRNFWEILEKARGHGIRVTVSTNATLINREKAKRLKANGIDWVATSLYGPDEFHDKMVGVPGTRAKVIEAVKILREEGVGVAIKTAVSKDTWPYIYDIIAETKKIDAGLIYLCDLITSGRSEGEEDIRISSGQWRELADFILEDLLDPDCNLEYDIGALPSVIPYLAEKLKARGVDVSKGLDRLQIVSACPVGKGHMNINSEGGIMPCQFAQDWTVGNIRDTTLEQAVHELYKLDQMEAKGACAPDVCEYSRICRGCRAKAWQGTGDAMEVDTTCILHPDEQRTVATSASQSEPSVSPATPCGNVGSC